MWVFLYIKYSNFWSILLEHFVELKPLISEEWCTTLPFFNLFQMAGHQLWGLLLGISLVTIGLGGLALADCPEVCTCKWKGGKQTVECINASLSSIPSLEAGTQVLDLSLNYLPTLRTDTFSKHNLTNLQKIYLPRCSLRILEVHTFR